MNLPGFSIAKITRSSLTILLMAALVLRGLIPVGYMPEFSAKVDVPSIRICGGTHNHGEDPAHNKEAPCPFSVNAAFSFAGVQGPAFAALIIFYIVTLTALALNITPLRRFGNASPRAPPLFS